MLPTAYDFAFPLAHGQRIGFHVFGNRSACGYGGAVVNPEGGDEFGIGTDKHVIPDDRFMFLDPVVVAGDRPGADVDPFSHLAVADIAEVVGLSSPSNIRLFYLDEIADMHVFVQS